MKQLLYNNCLSFRQLKYGESHMTYLARSTVNSEVKHTMHGIGVHDVVVHDVGMHDMGGHDMAVHDVTVHDVGMPGMAVPSMDVHKM